MILESIVTTIGSDGQTHIAPLGVHRHERGYIIAPFRPSRTLNNLLHCPQAVVNFTDDVRVFAGCLTGRRDWPLEQSTQVAAMRLSNSLSHCEVRVVDTIDSEERPRFICEPVFEQMHRPFRGFNRAQAAVIEAAILVSRLHMLAPEKIDQELAYLTIAIDKTAGDHEQIAWSWLMQKIQQHRLSGNT